MRVSAAAQGLLRPLLVSFPRPRRWGSNVSVEPRQSVVVWGESDPVSSSVSVCIERRGRYVIPAPTVRATDPLGLVAGSAKVLADEVLLVYPRFYAMESFQLPLGRRYQPGGIPLASHTGDSLEFLGTREYQPGDPLRYIHWRSWARLGKPVVMEFQEEYFSRIALILDTFVPKKGGPRGLRSLDLGGCVGGGFLQPERLHRRHLCGGAGYLRSQRGSEPRLSREHSRCAGVSRALQRGGFRCRGTRAFREARANHERRGRRSGLGLTACRVSSPSEGDGC